MGLGQIFCSRLKSSERKNYHGQSSRSSWSPSFHLEMMETYPKDKRAGYRVCSYSVRMLYSGANQGVAFVGIIVHLLKADTDHSWVAEHAVVLFYYTP